MVNKQDRLFKVNKIKRTTLFLLIFPMPAVAVVVGAALLFLPLSQ